jgi:hypothetical protein
MGPDVCRFISEQVYEGRLTSHPDTAKQRVTGTALPETGAFWVPVPHEGNAQIAQEEVDAIGKTVTALLDGSWTEKDGSTRPMRATARPLTKLSETSYSNNTSVPLVCTVYSPIWRKHGKLPMMAMENQLFAFRYTAALAINQDIKFVTNI